MGRSDAKGHKAFDRALSRWVAARGFDRSLPGYAILGDGRRGRLAADILLEEFVESYKTRGADAYYRREVRVLAEGQDANLLIAFVVTAMRPIQSPLEEETVEAGRIVYAQYPDWVGSGQILEPQQGGARKVVNRVRFCLEVNDRNAVCGGDIQFIDRQPQAYR